MNGNKLMLVGIGAALAFLTVFLVIRYFLDRRRQHMEHRLNGVNPEDASDTTMLLTNGSANGEKDLFARMDHGFEETIRQTGLDIKPDQALGLIALLGVACGAAMYLLREELWMGLLGVAIGMGIPLTAFIVMRGRYRKQLQEQLPDSFYLLARSVRAGLTLPQAIELAGTDGVKPLADEFKRCSAQINLGMTVGGALKLMADRVGLLDFRALVSTVTLYQHTGGNLALLLDRLAAGARDRNQFRAHFRSATALARVGAVGIGSALPLLLLGYALFQPEHIQTFFTTAVGWAMLGVAVGLELIGCVWMYQLLRVDY
ncbi:MAG: type II secretion system F family protein [Gemmataceae bacterium]|nr:type II secretion system F family protein [Gemmataceae bacterium]